MVRAPLVCHHFAWPKPKYDAMELITAHVRYGELLLTSIREHLRLKLASTGCNQHRFPGRPPLYRHFFRHKPRRMQYWFVVLVSRYVETHRKYGIVFPRLRAGWRLCWFLRWLRFPFRQHGRSVSSWLNASACYCLLPDHWWWSRLGQSGALDDHVHVQCIQYWLYVDCQGTFRAIASRKV